MIYSKDDISKFYTSLVQFYINLGFTINIQSMRGSQGDDSKIDLVKGDQIVRIIVNSIHDMYVRTYYVVSVLRFRNTGTDLYWNHKAESSTNHYFLKAKDRTNYYMVSEKRFNKIIETIRTRGRRKYKLPTYRELDSKYYQPLKKIVQNMNIPGWKRFNIKDVSTRTVDGTTYYLFSKSDGQRFGIKRVFNGFIPD